MIGVTDLSLSQGDFSLKDVNLVVPDGEYGVLMGRSGCGKTTVLEVVCGLRPFIAGDVKVSGRSVGHLKPAERGIGYVPQDRALFPTMRVRDQIAFSLIVRSWTQAEIASRVDELAELLGITNLLDRMPFGLSGGEAQRVALARALAFRPSALCLDEPLSALDEDLHDEICDLLADVHRQTGVTVLHITHSHSEAKRLAGVHFRMEKGAITVVEKSA